MKKALLSVVLGISVISCSNIKKDYIIADASYLPAPKWVKKGKYETSKKDEYKYFISKGENSNQRLCEKTARSRANLVVASEISSNIEDVYKNIINSNESESSEVTSEKLQQNIKLNLAGIENEETYWEKRQYQTKLGASKDVTKYQCYSLVKMNKENYNKAVNLSVEKMLSSISNEVKQEVINTVIENENN